MTPQERDVWIAVYAASWHAPRNPARDTTEVDDDSRADWAVRQATRAVAALRVVCGRAGFSAAEALTVDEVTR